MTESSDQKPSLGQAGGLSAFENVSLGMRPVITLGKLIHDSLNEEVRKNVTRGSGVSIGFGNIARLAIDALGNNDPEFLIDLYHNGGHISEDVLYDLGTAVIRGRRTKRDSLEIFNELQKKHSG